MLRIGYFGDGRWAQLALDKMLDSPFLDVAYVVLRFNAPDETLRRQAESRGIPCFQVRNVNDDAFLEKIRAYAVDLNVSMSFDQILKKDIIQLAPKGSLTVMRAHCPSTGDATS